MAIYLIPEQQQALEQSGGKPVAVVDPVTGKVYYLVSAEMYERIKSLLGIASRIRGTLSACRF